MKVTTYIAKFLKDKGINTVFELQGGMITRIIDAFHTEGGIKIVSMHHEQAAAMAADAFGRIKNKPGIALATSGPGATNLLTGIGNCFFDSVPAIFITGQVNTNEQKGELPIRQLGFQETDIVNMAKPITKAAYAITRVEEVQSVLEDAFKLAISGRPGPVLIDLPMNIQNQDIILTEVQYDLANVVSTEEEYSTFYETYIEALKKSQRPLILVGRGIRASNSFEVFLQFLENIKVPVVTSLLGIDAIPYNHPLRAGFIGTYGNRWANYSLGKCDVLLVLGSRLDLRQTGADVSSFGKDKKIFHVDIDKAELNNRITECTTLNSDLGIFFKKIIPFQYKFEVIQEWITEIQDKKNHRSDVNELENIKGINPNILLHKLSHSSHQAKAFVTDVGNNQMWAAQSIEILDDQLFLTSGGMGAMGYALPASIGASITLGNQPVICIAGDGGFQINIQELQTIQRNNLPIKIVILNNRCLGMIRQFQDAYFDSCYQSTVWGYDTPNFTKVAEAYGIDSFSIESVDDIESGLSRLWNNPMKPFLLNVFLDIHTNVYPKMMFGNPITKMEPLIKYD